MHKKEQLIKDIQNLLNSYSGIDNTSINKNLLGFMDEKTLITIINSLLIQKENSIASNKEWLEKFKIDK